MKQTVTESMFVDAFAACGRKANFSHSGRVALFNWLEAYEDDAGEEMELDVIAICCDFSEYKTLEEWAKEFSSTEYLIEACETLGIDEDIAMSTDIAETSDAIREYLEERTIVIEHDDGVIIQSF